jgi:anti-sigma B factor antagonist
MALEIEVQQQDSVCVVHAAGEVDLYSSPQLREAIGKAASASQTLAVGLEEVSYMDSSGVATLVEGLRACKKRNARFLLLKPSPSVLKVLQLARLDAVFEIQDRL